jgi:hypothetical protein
LSLEIALTSFVAYQGLGTHCGTWIEIKLNFPFFKFYRKMSKKWSLR